MELTTRTINLSPSTAEVLFSVDGCISGLISAVYISYALLGSRYFCNPTLILAAPEVYWLNSPGVRPASFQDLRSSPFRPSLDLAGRTSCRSDLEALAAGQTNRARRRAPAKTR